jgi:hypothetical protein
MLRECAIPQRGCQTPKHCELQESRDRRQKSLLKVDEGELRKRRLMAWQLGMG